MNKDKPLILLFHAKQSLDRSLIRTVSLQYKDREKWLVAIWPPIPPSYHHLPAIEAMLHAEQAETHKCLHEGGQWLGVPKERQLMETGQRDELLRKYKEQYPGCECIVLDALPIQGNCMSLTDWLRYHWDPIHQNKAAYADNYFS